MLWLGLRLDPNDPNEPMSQSLVVSKGCAERRPAPCGNLHAVCSQLQFSIVRG
eukprot:CAMPEP_0194777160 /NCGR_PEP_ID=MMETSP0323_2-20130528/64930_1 /TAXON_ID=2866 ORGANISM="Crypthecodinium cohnii, Strain Seligo" /NCGR_SAMPLE_ID=MMETSP0323_2 /ASSEMBLY_ACC=CAM_ASM_000346 /LENGTH=52 /DNA_ID=CAMNT_0039713855 /DNA_START=188 /DNA_END=342 /DNA_ORIENTATION=+